MKGSDSLSLEVDEERWRPLNGLYIAYTYCFDLQYQLWQYWDKKASIRWQNSAPQCTYSDI